MSRLNEMIQELCPDGVEYRPIKDCVESVEKIEWKKTDETYRYIDLSSVDREDHIIGETIEIGADDAPSRAQQLVKENDILLGTTRPMLKRYCQIPLEYDNQICSTGFCVLRANNIRVLSRWLYHMISTTAFFDYVDRTQHGSSYPAISDKEVKAYDIPIPPLPIQNEIVKLLDSFTELTAKLTAELVLRKKQYNFYRDSLLNFSQNASSVEWKTLREVSVHICSGGTPTASNSAYYSGDIPWLRTQEVDWTDIYDTDVKISEEGLKKSSARWIPANCVIVAMYGATAAKVAINRIPLTTNQACCNMEINENVATHKYVYHWVCSQYENLKSKGQGSQSNINKKIIEEYPIPIPPLVVQQKIVSILDRFDALCNDLTSGLPAEIAARKKQYEHYRDKLLTFPRSNG